MLIDGYAALGVEQKFCPVAASCTLVALSALLTGLNVFDNIAKYAGAGTLVPITGASPMPSPPPPSNSKPREWFWGSGPRCF